METNQALCVAKYGLTIDSCPCTQKRLVQFPFPCIYPFFPSLIQYLLSTYYVLETHLVTKDTLVNKRDKISHLHRIYILMAGNKCLITNIYMVLIMCQALI